MKKGVQLFTFMSLIFISIISDKNLVKVKAESSLKDQSIIQVDVLINNYDEDYIKAIELDDGTLIGDHDYVINYLPDNFISRNTISKYFNYGAWITRDGVISLSLDPTLKVRTNKTEKNNAWSVVSSKTQGFASSSYWKNTTPMKLQFDCHYDKLLGKLKDKWNLEPHRTSTSYQKYLDTNCNP